MTTTDYERVTVEPDSDGPPVDQPTTPAPARTGWRGLARTLVTLAVRLLAWSPRGAWRCSVAAARWLADTSGRPAPLAEGTDPDAYRRAAELHDLHVKHRLTGAAVVVAVLAAAGGLAWWLAPRWVFWVVAVVVLVTLARVGKPEGGRLVDPVRVRTGPAYTRLTAELVRGALVSLRLPGLKSPEDVTFAAEIHRDGPGQLARVNLPAGIEAATVVAARGKLSSALRLPVDQVWPGVGPDHEGQLDLWVGYRPTSKMTAPRWELTGPDARVSVFEPFSVGADQRQRPVSTPLFARNFLIGGVPGSGKSYAARALALGAALDPTVELKIAELKGTADFGDLAPLASAYVCGIDDASLEEAGQIITWGLGEAARRAERIRKFREKGLAPEGKVTPELARRNGSGLHPVVIVVDEAHELLTDKKIAEAAERLIKRGRALAIVVVLATQIPDRESVPPAITRCVNVRWCLAVQDHVANDMILGTGAYKRGVSTLHYAPERDAGWGVVVGLGQPQHVRSHFADEATGAAIIRRARALRGDQVISGDPDIPERDPVADALAVFEGDRMHWSTLCERLVERFPDRWSGETRSSVAALLRGLGVVDEPVSVAGVKQRGCRRAALENLAGN